MVFFLVLLDSSDDRSCPLDYQILEAISLIQIGVHELLHGFSGQVALLTFLIELRLLRIDVID